VDAIGGPVTPLDEDVDTGSEVLEHQADLGIRAWGPTVEDAFRRAGWALADLLGVRANATGGEERHVRATAADRDGLLVDFLNELLTMHEAERVGFAGIEVRAVTETELDARVDIVPIEGTPDGTPVKAATFHRLRVDEHSDGSVEVRVYLDV
jgi:SHS2 domain-containing protein